MNLLSAAPHAVKNRHPSRFDPFFHMQEELVFAGPPRAIAYEIEAAEWRLLSREGGHDSEFSDYAASQARAFESVVRRLSWTPSALRAWRAGGAA